MADYESETKAYPGSVTICEHVIVPPGEWFRFELPPNHTYELPVERVENGAYIMAKWRVGDHEYDWSYHGSEQSTYRFVRTRERPAE